MKSGIAKNVLLAFVGFIGFAVVQAVVKSVIREPREHAEKTYEQLQADAIKKHPDIPLSQAMQQEASEKASKMITSEADELKRTNNAASMFWGFFFVNTRERPEFCREQGVDIQPFVKAFEHAHANEIAKGRSIFARASVDEETLYMSIKPQLRKGIVQDTNDIATSNKISIKEGCQRISDNADALVREWHLSKINPTVFKTLTSGK